MSEEVVTFGENRTLVGILHRPEDGCTQADLPCVLLLNAGILHRVGPNRLYVQMARQLAHAGFNVLRFDVWGIGDSLDHSASGSGTFFDDTFAAMAFLGREVGAHRFMLMGVCMGARIALQVAARDARVESLVLMEGIYIKSTRYYVSRILDPLKWKRLLTGRSHKIRLLRERGAALLRRAADKRRAAPTEDSKPKVLLLEETGEKSVNSVLRALLARAVKIMLLFRDGNEIAYNYHLQMDGDDIVAVGLPDGLRVEFVRFADHTFTPLISQELLLKTTMRWIERTHFSSRKPFKIAA